LKVSDEIKGDSSPLQPVYPSTEKLKARSLGGRQIAKLTRHLLTQLREKIFRNLYRKKFETKQEWSAVSRHFNPYISLKRLRPGGAQYTV
jgi:hypothetical protein